MEKKMEDYTEFLCFQIGALSRRMARFWNGRLAEINLPVTLTQSYVLLALLKKDGLSVKEIAGAVQLDSSAITGLVDRLVKEGCVVRREDPEDRRSLQVVLTPEGREIAEKAFECGVEVNEEFIKDLTGDEIVSLVRAQEALDRRFAASKKEKAG